MKLTRSAILIVALPAAASAQGVPGDFYVLINNTSRDQTCAIKWPGTNWSPWFKVARSQNWMGRRTGQSLSIQCRPPVEQVRYTLAPGKRYSLLRAGGGSVEIVEVTAGDFTGTHQ